MQRLVEHLKNVPGVLQDEIIERTRQSVQQDMIKEMRQSMSHIVCSKIDDHVSRTVGSLGPSKIRYHHDPDMDQVLDNVGEDISNHVVSNYLEVNPTLQQLSYEYASSSGHGEMSDDDEYY